jgi:hypothetical protein
MNKPDAFTLVAQLTLYACYLHSHEQFSVRTVKMTLNLMPRAVRQQNEMVSLRLGTHERLNDVRCVGRHNVRCRIILCYTRVSCVGYNIPQYISTTDVI